MKAHASADAVSAGKLAEHLAGRVATPADSDWDTVRSAWNLGVDQRPEMVAYPANASDVAAIVGYARAHRLLVTPQSTGHNAAARGDLNGTILLRTDRMRELAVNPQRRIVRAGAGVVWAEVTQALAPHGLAARAGSSGDVGVTGYTLGGGYSWLARPHGLAASAVTAAELVTGDGAVHRVDADTEPELFWAVRGGAGNVGIVTALEFRALPLTEVYGGALLFPISRAAEVLAVYRQWTLDLDERATTCVRLLRLPPLPELPEVFRGKSFAAVDGAIDAPVGEAERLLAPLRALGPSIDMFAPMPAAGLGQIHMDPPAPVPFVVDGFVLDDLPAEAIDALLAVAGPGVDCPLLLVDLRHMGGAVGRPDPHGGAVDHLPGQFLLFAVGITPVPEAAVAVEQAVSAVHAALAPWASDRDYANFRETATPAARLYPRQTLTRLLAVQAAHDPDRVIRVNHPIDTKAR